jgi:hypothetical protein
MAQLVFFPPSRATVPFTKYHLVRGSPLTVACPRTFDSKAGRKAACMYRYLPTFPEYLILMAAGITQCIQRWVTGWTVEGFYCLCSTESRPATGPTQLLIQRIPEVKLPGREAEHSPISN